MSKSATKIYSVKATCTLQVLITDFQQAAYQKQVLHASAVYCLPVIFGMVVPTVPAAPIANHQHICYQIWSIMYTLQMHMVAHTVAASLTVASWALCASNQQLNFDLLHLISLFPMSAVPASTSLHCECQAGAHHVQILVHAMLTYACCSLLQPWSPTLKL